MGNIHTNERISLKNIFFLSFIILLFSHFTVTTYFPNIIINIGTIALIAYIILNNTLYKKNIFLFIILIYILSHFVFGASQGGLFNIISFMIILFSFLNNIKLKELKYIDDVIYLLLFILIISNIIGWIFKNNAGPLDLFKGIACFFGYIFMFNISRKTYLTQYRIKIFLLITIALSIYNFVFNVNNMLGLLQVQSPAIFGGSEKMFGNLKGASGIIGSSAIMGEESLMFLVIFLSFYFSKKLLVKNYLLIIGILTTLANMVFSGSRSIFILGGFIILLYIIFINNNLFFRSFGKQRQTFIFLFFSIAFVSLFITNFIDFKYLQHRLTFSDITATEISYETVVFGSAVHRDWAFEVGRDNLARESWWVGYGWGIGKVNRQAWFVNPHINRTSPHSMYYGIIPLFGWFGSLAYIGIILVTLKRLFVFIRKNRLTNNYLLIPAISFFIIFLIRLVNGYKADIIYLPHYFMVFWILLGLANSIPYTNKKINYTKGLKYRSF